MRTLTPQETAALKGIIDQGVSALGEINEIRTNLREDVKAVAESLEIAPKLINKAIKVSYKRNLGEEKNSLSEVEDLLVSAGKKV